MKEYYCRERYSNEGVFSEVNITVKSPGRGVRPMRYDEVIEGVAQKNYSKDELNLNRREITYVR